MSGTPIGSSKNIGPIEKSEEVAGSSTEISAKLVHHGKQAEKEIKFPAKIEKLSKEEMVMDLKLIHGLALPPKAGINSENTKKPKDSVIEKMNAFIEKVELDDSDHKITTKDLEDGFVIVDKFTQITTEDLEDGFVIINNKNALINDFKAKSEVLGTNYLNKFEFNQLETLNKVVEVVKSGNTEEAKTKLEGLSENLQKTGINKSEADAIKSMLLRENIDRLAPGLNFLNDSQYDYKNDASIKELSTKEFQVFFQKQDLKGSLAEEIRTKLIETFANKFKGELGDPDESKYKVIDKINESFKNGQISKEEIKNCLGKYLVNDLPRAFDTEVNLAPEFFNRRKDKGNDELANLELKAKLEDSLVDNLLSIKNGKSFIDLLSTAGASKKGAGKGTDDTRKGYSGFSDSISRMENRCNIFEKMISAENPQEVFTVKEKELKINLVETREKIKEERDLKNELAQKLSSSLNLRHDPIILNGGPKFKKNLEEEINICQSAINELNSKLVVHLFNELSIERKLKDLKDISILIIPKLMDEEINKVNEKISKSVSPDKEKQLEKEKKELEELKENKEKILSNIKQMSKLDKNEITAIVGYTSEFYNQINDGLRFNPLGLSNNKENKDLLNWTKVLKSALNKLESVEGEVYRAEGKSQRLNTKVSGNLFADLASTSTASKMSGTIGAYQRGTLSVYNIKNGKSIADLSHFGRGEKEVLIPPAIMMRVTSRFEKKPEDNWIDVINSLREEAKNDQEKIQLIDKLEKIINEEQKFLEAENKGKKAGIAKKPSDLVIFHEEHQQK